MYFDNESISKEYEKLNFNHPGFDYPLQYRWVKKSDALALSKVIKNSKDHLKGFISWAKFAGNWNFRNITRFVNDLVDCEPPYMHLVFTLGNQIVGMGSLAPAGDSRSVQIALWVAENFDGKGIGTRIALTMEQYAFEVFGYEHLYYQHDALNESSKRLPQKLGFRFSHTFDDSINALDESGFWMSWVKDRPTNLPPGLLQGAPMEQFTEIRFK